MKTKIFILLLSISQIGISQFWHSKEKLYGNGHVITQKRKMSPYDKITVVGPYDVQIVPGNATTIQLTADENLLQAIDTYVKSGKLVIRVHPNFDIRKYTKLFIEIPADYLSKISLTGSGNIYNQNPFDWNNIKLVLTGSGNMDFQVNNKHTEVSLTGSGSVLLTGQTNILEIAITGSGDIDAKQLMAQSGKVTITGSGDALVRVSERLNIKIFGSGDVYYYGEPRNLKTKSFGSGETFYKPIR